MTHGEKWFFLTASSNIKDISIRFFLHNVYLNLYLWLLRITKESNCNRINRHLEGLCNIYLLPNKSYIVTKLNTTYTNIYRCIQYVIAFWINLQRRKHIIVGNNRYTSLFRKTPILNHIKGKLDKERIRLVKMTFHILWLQRTYSIKRIRYLS